jgi:hypothetical protein
MGVSQFRADSTPYIVPGMVLTKIKVRSMPLFLKISYQIYIQSIRSGPSRVLTHVEYVVQLKGFAGLSIR